MTARKDNMAASVRQRLLNRARERREDFGLLLTRFGTERLLYRLGESEYGGAFGLRQKDKGLSRDRLSPLSFWPPPVSVVPFSPA